MMVGIPGEPSLGHPAKSFACILTSSSQQPHELGNLGLILYEENGGSQQLSTNPEGLTAKLNNTMLCSEYLLVHFPCKHSLNGYLVPRTTLDLPSTLHMHMCN